MIAKSHLLIASLFYSLLLNFKKNTWLSSSLAARTSPFLGVLWGTQKYLNSESRILLYVIIIKKFTI